MEMNQHDSLRISKLENKSLSTEKAGHRSHKVRGTSFKTMKSRQWCFIYLYILVFSTLIQENSSKVVRIGCLIAGSRDSQLSALKLAVEYVNTRQLLGPGTTLEYICNNTQSKTSFEILQLGCYQSELGVMAFIGLAGSGAHKALSPLSEALHIPQIAPTATNPMLASEDNFPYLVRLSAPDSVQSQAIVSLVHHFGWEQVAILTSNTDYGIHGLLQFQSEAAKRGWKVVSVQQFVVTNDVTLNATHELNVIKETGVRIILLNCGLSHAKVVLQQAKEANMTGAGWAWIATDGITGSSDLSTNPVSDQYLGILGTKPAVGRGSLYDNFYSEWKALDPLQYPGAGHGSELSAYSGLIVDAVLAFSYAVQSMYSDPANAGVTQTSVKCHANQVWNDGSTMLRYISSIDGDGVNNRIDFKQSRIEPEMPVFDIVNLKEDGWHKVGSWDSVNRLTFTNKADITFHGNKHTVTDYVSDLASKHLIIVTKEENPFVMFTKEPEDPNNIKDDEIEGFCIDLLKNLSSRIGFTYTLKRSPDGNWGAKNNVTRKWNGMARELVDRKADMVVASYTITNIRERDFDFTTPYLDLGMKFLMKEELTEVPEPFKFLNPFSTEVYLYVILTTVLVSIYTSLLNKLSPYDHHGGFVYDDEPPPREYLDIKNYARRKFRRTGALNFVNASWFSIASLLLQGGEHYPRSLSARITTVMWWMGIVIIIQTYTANLAAFLTAGRLNNDINSIEDLGSQTRVIYGTVRGTSPHQFFIDSNITLYKEMHGFMEANGGLVQNTVDAVEWVREGNYAFIWDDVVLDYIVQNRPCNTVKTVGRLFGKIGYGFALQKNSPYKHEISTHILQLREMGYMDELKKKWYEDRSDCFDTSSAESEDNAELAAAGGRMGIEHMLGVFFIIYGGLALSLVVLFFEWIIASIAVIGKLNMEHQGPKTFKEALTLRFRLLRQDMKEDWLPTIPYCFRRGDKHKQSEQEELNEINKEYKAYQFKSQISLRSSFNKAMLSMTKVNSSSTDQLLRNTSRASLQSCNHLTPLSPRQLSPRNIKCAKRQNGYPQWDDSQSDDNEKQSNIDHKDRSIDGSMNDLTNEAVKYIPCENEDSTSADYSAKDIKDEYPDFEPPLFRTESSGTLTSSDTKSYRSSNVIGSSIDIEIDSKNNSRLSSASTLRRKLSFPRMMNKVQALPEHEHFHHDFD
ncbi:unnamed protein product [Owenia fusiformis]|uniref:Uncharacterized protein n=1 Tax=Owenia fusiformis TaxID=6347 RepID=A0A8S4P6B1_OWEFU|nr:unnamed protein product [Owenia fusiformis]